MIVNIQAFVKMQLMVSRKRVYEILISDIKIDENNKYLNGRDKNMTIGPK